MKEKFNIERPELKRNPYTVPEGYFGDLQSIISDRISKGKRAGSAWRVIKPQLALLSVFAFVFLIGYGVIKTIPAKKSSNEYYLIDRSELLKNYQLKTSFIDFYDQATDSLTRTKKNLDPEEIIEYLDADAGLLYLASLEI
jgi:hypothetical protein